jgi:hypothetical protein
MGANAGDVNEGTTAATTAGGTGKLCIKHT